MDYLSIMWPEVAVEITERPISQKAYFTLVKIFRMSTFLDFGFLILNRKLDLEVLSKLTKIDICQMTEIPFYYSILFGKFLEILKNCKIMKMVGNDPVALYFGQIDLITGVGEVKNDSFNLKLISGGRRAG